MQTLDRNPDNNAARLLAICNGILPPRERNTIVNASLLAHAGRHRDAEFARRGAKYDRPNLIDVEKV